jgi:hypothetical protein
MVGAYEFNWTQSIRGSGHLEPVVFALLAVNGDRAEVVNASRTYGTFGDGARWFSISVNVKDNRIAWDSVGDWYKLELKWKDANSGSFSSLFNKGKGGGGADWPGETRPFKRLDG